MTGIRSERKKDSAILLVIRGGDVTPTSKSSPHIEYLHTTIDLKYYVVKYVIEFFNRYVP